MRYEWVDSQRNEHALADELRRQWAPDMTAQQLVDSARIGTYEWRALTVPLRPPFVPHEVCRGRVLLGRASARALVGDGQEATFTLTTSLLDAPLGTVTVRRGGDSTDASQTTAYARVEFIGRQHCPPAALRAVQAILDATGEDGTDGTNGNGTIRDPPDDSDDVCTVNWALVGGAIAAVVLVIVIVLLLANKK
jgi:hypothetical protein